MNRLITRLALTAAAIVAGGSIVANAQTAATGAAFAVVSDKGDVRLAEHAFPMGQANPSVWTIEVVWG